MGYMQIARALQWGMELESLRVDKAGQPSRAPHPFELDEPNITKDFAESQVELVSDVFSSYNRLLDHIDLLKQRVQKKLESEYVWPFSMPPSLKCCPFIPVASFDNTKSGREAHAYRQYLLKKHGVQKQLICGIHLNFSIQNDVIQKYYTDSNSVYVKLARHIYDNLDLLVLLTGASPFDGNTTIHDPVISVRNSDKGYGGDSFEPYLKLDSLEGYISSIKKGIKTDIHIDDLICCQLPSGYTTFLSEKEFYAPVRLKQTPESNESMLEALSKRGVSHIELRIFDINPFERNGVNPHVFPLLRLLIIEGFFSDPESLDPVSGARRARVAAGTRLSDLHNSPLLKTADRKLVELQDIAYQLKGIEKDESLAAVHYFRNLLKHPDTLPASRLYSRYIHAGKSWNALGIDWLSSKKEVEYA